MKTKILLITTSLVLAQSVFANIESEKSQNLLNVLNSTSFMDTYPDLKDDFDADEYVNRYKRGWEKKPAFNLSSNEVKAGKEIIEVKITAFPDGRIQNVELLESTGFAKTDQKVLAVLKKSKLRAMPYPDETVTYDTIQKIKVI